MTSVEEIRARFDAAREHFDIDDGQPSESYISKIVEELGGILFTIRYDSEKGEDNLIGIVIPQAEYTIRYNRAFQRPARPAVYDDRIVDGPVTNEVRKAEAKWRAKIHDWELYDVAEEESRRFIMDSVDEVWIAELKRTVTVYAEVTAFEMLEHLRVICVGTHEIDILDLQDQMRELHLKVDTIPEYIEAMEKAQEQARRAENEISEAMVVNMATRAMLATERYPKANDDWEDLDKPQRTWATWKTMYRAADLKAKIKKKARHAQFGGMATKEADEKKDEDSQPVTLTELEDCFDSLATAAVTGKDSIDSLVKSNALLTKTNAELSALVKSQAADIKSGGGGRRNRDKKGADGDKPRRVSKYCPHCKRDTWHDPDECFELSKNKDKRSSNWKSVFDTN